MLLISQILFFIALVGFIFSLVAIMIIPENKLKDPGEGEQLFWIFILSLLIMAMNISSVLSDILVIDTITP